ncbi:fungal-specific transcription factor domain-containing protein [Crucibulum laeve]|uniref:Fungal-specific transcription factor domain-containing protein n=1 Tax=Crucibulum laeve TaxID=68775 RepID=A0A5C3LXW4_9AGAR|nr:fungal-specific transcription factor domain-containing protein [Crucibulum laeve]
MAASLTPVPPTMRNSIDLKANGEVSRMRNHKGNMPSLPQTKYCSLCPAKFTRTTHLNRHLRSHTNERSHRCNICNAEFTRSDLLTRHKRTCGDSSNSNRSRRKSCQACAESKVKCNLQYPCSKCDARGKECIFINDPETSRNKKNAKKASHQSSSSESTESTPGIDTAPSSVLGSASPIEMSPSSMYSSLYTANANSFPSPALSHASSSLSTSHFPTVSSLIPPSLSHSSSSSPSSSRGSPRSDFFDVRNDVSNSFDTMGFDTVALDTRLDHLFPAALFDTFSTDTLSPCSPQTANQGEFTPWMESGGTDMYAGYNGEESFFSHQLGLDNQNFVPQYSTLQNHAMQHPPRAVDPPFPISPAPPAMNYGSSGPAPVMHPQGPAPEELDHYLYLFFNAFCPQMPLMHQSTWQLEKKPLILVQAMQACGALFVKTRTAVNFINDTLVAGRDTLVLEFAKTTSDVGDQMNLILAIVLLQCIGLFHQRADQRLSSNVYHGMLVMMIRRTGLIARIASWSPPDLTDMQSLEAGWRDWARYETVKRALFLSYLHDCCHCIYFSLPPSFHPAEFDINLPCDDVLWKAGNARDWFQAVQTPSPYGTGPSRACGVSMQRALATMTDIAPTPLPLNPFSYFILIHTILRNIYASRGLVTTSEGLSQPIPQQVDPNQEENLLTARYALQNWLQMWMTSPEAGRYEKSGVEPPFICNVKPFYWLAQVALVAVQEGKAGSLSKTTDGKDEGRFRLLREWFSYIKVFIRSGSQVPAHLWDELMKIRLQLPQLGNSTQDLHGGLLAFFPDSN